MGSPKLDKKLATRIRQLYKSGNMTYDDLATRFSVGSSTIGDIVQNKCYRDPSYTPPQMTTFNGLQVNSIRERYNHSSISQGRLATEYGVSSALIGRIVRNECYHDPNYQCCRENLYAPKLTKRDVADIRRQYKTGKSRKSLALDYGVSRNTIIQIINNIKHRNIGYVKKEMPDGSSIFKKDDVLYIRRTYPQKTMTELGSMFGVSRSAIHHIVYGKSYRCYDLAHPEPRRVRTSLETANEIRDRYRDEQITQYELADEYGLSQPMIWKIVHNKSLPNTGRPAETQARNVASGHATAVRRGRKLEHMGSINVDEVKASR